MPRHLTADQNAALDAAVVRPIYLVDIDLPSGRVRYWSGSGMLSYGGYDWLGAGLVGDISGLEQSTEVFISEVVATLAPLAADFEDAGESLKGHQMTIYVALLDDEMQIIGDALLIDVVDLDYEVVRREDQQASLQLIGQSGPYKLEEPIQRAWSSEAQKARYPGDTGMDGIPGLVEKDVTWLPS